MVRAYTAESYALASLNRKVEAAKVLDLVVDISRRNEDLPIVYSEPNSTDNLGISPREQPRSNVDLQMGWLLSV